LFFAGEGVGTWRSAAPAVAYPVVGVGDRERESARRLALEERILLGILLY
jgi:hypothetical protein